MKTTILLAIILLISGCGEETKQEKYARIQLEEFNTGCTLAAKKYSKYITRQHMRSIKDVPSILLSKESFVAFAGVQYYGCDVDSSVIEEHHDDAIDVMMYEYENREEMAVKQLADKIASLTNEQFDYCKAYNIQRAIDKKSTDITELYRMGLSTNKCMDIK